MPGDVPGFRRTEPIALRFIGGVIDAPGCTISFVFQSITQHERSHAKARACPDFLYLLVCSNETPVRCNAIYCAHFSVVKFHHVQIEDRLQRLFLHILRNQVAKSRHIRIPLAGKLVRLNIVAILA